MSRELREEEINRILAYLKDRAFEGACRLGDVRALAEELSMKPGRVKAVLYWLCGEGIILQQGDVVLLLKEEQGMNNV